jgi:hypothetical protein
MRYIWYGYGAVDERESSGDSGECKVYVGEYLHVDNELLCERFGIAGLAITPVLFFWT